AMIRKLTDVFRYEKHINKTDFKPVDMVSLAERVLKAEEADFAHKNITLSLEKTRGAATIEGEPDSLALSLTNLLSNALEFTPEGGTVTVRITSEDEYVSVDVVDSGPGVSQDEIDKMFSRLWQGGTGKNYPAETGLGLYLCKRVVEAHDGTISCFS